MGLVFKWIEYVLLRGDSYFLVGVNCFYVKMWLLTLQDFLIVLEKLEIQIFI